MFRQQRRRKLKKPRKSGKGNVHPEVDLFSAVSNFFDFDNLASSAAAIFQGQDEQEDQGEKGDSLKQRFKGWEHWSSGYGRRLMFWKAVGLIPSTVYWMDICCKKCNACLKNDENKWKEAKDGSFFWKKTQG